MLLTRLLLYNFGTYAGSQELNSEDDQRLSQARAQQRPFTAREKPKEKERRARDRAVAQCHREGPALKTRGAQRAHRRPELAVLVPNLVSACTGVESGQRVRHDGC